MDGGVTVISIFDPAKSTLAFISPSLTGVSKLTSTTLSSTPTTWILMSSWRLADMWSQHKELITGAIGKVTEWRRTAPLSSTGTVRVTECLLQQTEHFTS